MSLKRSAEQNLVILLCASFTFGQSPAPSPKFDVISVKPTPPARLNQLSGDYCSSGGNFFVSGRPVLWSIRYAFGTEQISKAPAWLETFDTAYDIEARPATPVNNAECRLMLQSLFADRFKLAVHRAMEEAPVYFLVVGKNGPKLKQASQVRLNGSIQIGASGKPDWADGMSMTALARVLSNYAGRIVIDRTNLPGAYGFDLTFSRTDADALPSIFTAVQEQLGLRLESGKAPVETVVIDHIERPSEN